MFSNDQPAYSIDKPLSIKLIEFLTFILVFLTFSIPLIYYSDLPDIIPVNVGWDGEVNKYDEKSMIWFLPLLSLTMVIGMHKLKQLPHLFNYSTKITKDNYIEHYSSAVKIMSIVTLLLAILFLVVTYEFIIVALYELKTFSTIVNIFIKIILGILTFFPVLYLINYFVKRKEN